MKTINTSFNTAWELLEKYHPSAGFPSGSSLDLQCRENKHGKAERTLPQLPRVKRRAKQEWNDYISALLELIAIGLRNRWLHFHVDGAGKVAYLYVPGSALQRTHNPPPGHGGSHLSA